MGDLDGPVEKARFAFSALGFAFGFLGLFTLVTGAITFIQDNKRRVKKDDENRVCSDREVMHYFAEKEVRFCEYIFCQKETVVPKVPNIEKLLNLGDDLFYTSRVFDHASPPPSPREATWVWLYRTILDGILQNEQNLDLLTKRPPPEYIRVKDVPQGHIPGNMADTRNIWERDTRQSIDEGDLVRCIELFSGWQSQFRLGWDRNDPDEEVLWTTSRSGRRRCLAGGLEPDPEGAPFRSPLRVISGRPYIQISREQLYGLALSLGAPLHWDPHLSSFRGSAAFGIDITVEYQHAEGFWRVRLEHSKRRPRHPRSKGSGYSIRLAKHMACGLLPFARAQDQDTSWFMKAVYVSEKVLEAIRSGEVIHDLPVGVYNDSVEYMRQLPYSKWTYLWAHYGVCGHGNTGEIMDIADQTRVGWWWEAVCGIAFGGLVPQTTAELKEAIRFTMAGLSEIVMDGNDTVEDQQQNIFRDPELPPATNPQPQNGQNPDEIVRLSLENALEYLINLLDDQYHTEGNQYEKLFGDWVAERKTDPTTDYTIHCGDTRDAAAVFGKYQTILERITALCRPHGAQGRVPPADKLDAVFEATKGLVERSYLKSVSTEDTRRWSLSTETTYAPGAHNGSEKLGEVIFKITKAILFNEGQGRCTLSNGHIQPRYCAWIAACIIAAWANQVPVIHVASHRPTSEEKSKAVQEARRSGLDPSAVGEHLLKQLAGASEIESLQASELVAMADLPSVMAMG